MISRFGSPTPPQMLRAAGAAADKLTRDLNDLRKQFEEAGNWSEFPQELARSVMLGLVLTQQAARRLVGAAEGAAGNRHGVGLEIAFEVEGGGRLAVDSRGSPWLARAADAPASRSTVQEARAWLSEIRNSGQTLRPGPGREAWLSQAVEPADDHQPESN